MSLAESMREETIKAIERDAEIRAEKMTPEAALAWVIKAAANYRNNKKEFYEAIEVARKICFEGKMIINERKLGWAKFVKEAVTDQGGPLLRTIDHNLKKIEKERNKKDPVMVSLETLEQPLPLDECPTLVRANRRGCYLDIVLYVPRLRTNVPVSFCLN